MVTNAEFLEFMGMVAIQITDGGFRQACDWVKARHRSTDVLWEKQVQSSVASTSRDYRSLRSASNNEPGAAHQLLRSRSFANGAANAFPRKLSGVCLHHQRRKRHKQAFRRTALTEIARQFSENNL